MIKEVEAVHLLPTGFLVYLEVVHYQVYEVYHESFEVHDHDRKKEKTLWAISIHQSIKKKTLDCHVLVHGQVEDLRSLLGNIIISVVNFSSSDVFNWSTFTLLGYKKVGRMPSSIGSSLWVVDNNRSRVGAVTVPSPVSPRRVGAVGFGGRSKERVDLTNADLI